MDAKLKSKKIQVKKNKRFVELISKYQENTLTRSEFREFITLLNKSENMNILDDFLTENWHRENEKIYAKEPIRYEDQTSTYKTSKFYLYSRWQIAASFLILFTATVIFLLNGSPGEKYTSYSTGFAEIIDLKLPDGSMITLNANSTLTWENQWKKNGRRHVILEGEAFFVVKNLNNIPFRVKTGEVEVEVIGTSFNVENRNQQIEVYLDEGKVNLYMDHDKTKIISLDPGQKVKYDEKQRKIEKTENETMVSSASWKNGVLNFKDMEFRMVLENLKNIYGKSFKCEKEHLLSKKIYLGVPYSDWEAVRQALELSLDIKFTDSGDFVNISSNQ